MNNYKNLRGIFGRAGEGLLMCHMLGGATEILGGYLSPFAPPGLNPALTTTGDLKCADGI